MGLNSLFFWPKFLIWNKTKIKTNPTWTMSFKDSFHKNIIANWAHSTSPLPSFLLKQSTQLEQDTETRMWDLVYIANLTTAKSCSELTQFFHTCMVDSRVGECHELEHGEKTSLRSEGPQVWLQTPGAFLAVGQRVPCTKSNFSGRWFLTCLLIAFYRGLGQLRPSIWNRL